MPDRTERSPYHNMCLKPWRIRPSWPGNKYKKKKEVVLLLQLLLLLGGLLNNVPRLSVNHLKKPLLPCWQPWKWGREDDFVFFTCSGEPCGIYNTFLKSWSHHISHLGQQASLFRDILEVQLAPRTINKCFLCLKEPGRKSPLCLNRLIWRRREMDMSRLPKIWNICVFFWKN